MQKQKEYEMIHCTATYNIIHYIRISSILCNHQRCLVILKHKDIDNKNTESNE